MNNYNVLDHFPLIHYSYYCTGSNRGSKFESAFSYGVNHWKSMRQWLTISHVHVRAHSNGYPLWLTTSVTVR